MRNNILKHKGYFGTIDFSLPDDTIFGKIIGIDDLVTYEAKTLGELKETFIEAIDDYLDTCKEIGKKPNKNFSGVFNVRTSNVLHKELSFLATSRKMKLNEVVNIAFDYLIKNKETVLKV